MPTTFSCSPRSSALLAALLTPMAVLLAHCHSASEASPQTAASTAVPTPSESAPAAAAPLTAATSGYAMCGGQHVAGAAAASRVGPVQLQLAPAFLDEMPVCRAADGVPRELIERATQGQINAKGDCEFADIGVSCHYHSGSEFITSSSRQQTLGLGELHCIFPGDDPKTPHVYGGHVMCRDHAQGVPQGEPAHDVHAGASCSAELLKQLEPCPELRCCDAGTLTNPISELLASQRNDIRPDFRICDGTLEVDCDLLAPLTVHNANSPALGGVGAPVFVAAAHATAGASRHHP